MVVQLVNDTKMLTIYKLMNKSIFKGGKKTKKTLQVPQINMDG